MKLFVRREAEVDRQLKRIARANQRKADLRRAAMTMASESMTLHAREAGDGERSYEYRLGHSISR